MESDPNNKQKITVNPLKLWRDLKDAVLMFFNVCRGKYPLPKKSLIWGIIFLIYAVFPFDIIPDAFVAMFGLGAADDLLFLVYVLNKMSPDLEKFRFFKNAKYNNDSPIEAEVINENDEKVD